MARAAEEEEGAEGADTSKDSDDWQQLQEILKAAEEDEDSGGGSVSDIEAIISSLDLGHSPIAKPSASSASVSASLASLASSPGRKANQKDDPTREGAQVGRVITYLYLCLSMSLYTCAVILCAQMYVHIYLVACVYYMCVCKRRYICVFEEGAACVDVRIGPHSPDIQSPDLSVMKWPIVAGAAHLPSCVPADRPGGTSASLHTHILYRYASFTIFIIHIHDLFPTPPSSDL